MKYNLNISNRTVQRDSFCIDVCHGAFDTQQNTSLLPYLKFFKYQINFYTLKRTRNLSWKVHCWRLAQIYWRNLMWILWGETQGNWYQWCLKTDTIFWFSRWVLIEKKNLRCLIFIYTQLIWKWYRHFSFWISSLC